MMINVYALLAFAGCVLMLAVASLARSKEQPYSRNVQMLLRILGAWLFFEMLYYAVPGHPIQMTFDALRYTAISFVPLSVLLTVHLFLFGHSLRSSIHGVLSVFPIASLVLIATNSHHRLFFENRYFDFENGVQFVHSIYGTFYKFAYLPYAYACLGTALILSMWAIFRFSDYKRIQSGIIALALLIPMAGNAVYLFADGFSKSVDYTPFLFAASGLLFYVSIKRFGFLSVIPFAQEIVLDKMADAVFILDADDRLIEANDAAKTLLAPTSFEDILGRPVYEHLISASLNPDFFERSSSDKMTLSIETPEGISHFYLRDQTVLNQTGRRIGRLLLLHDITPLQEAMAALEREKQRAEEATQAKSQFVANISHEIRTPMTSIIGMADMLSEKEPPQAQAHLVKNIQISTKLLLQIVNDLLDYSKVEAGQLNLKTEPMHVRDTIGQVADMITPLLINRPIDFETRISPDIPQFLLGDSLRLKQILINILTNAAKYTERGKIDLEVILESQTQSTYALCFLIRDTGIGISQDDQARLFNEFFQVEDTNARRYSGTGLGLSIARHLAELMDGNINVKSALGEGSEFSIRIALAAAEAPEHSQALHMPSADHSRLRILLAEDNVMNREYMQLVFRKMKCGYDLAVNGKEAIRMAAENQYDIIFMDIQMPEMDGYEAAKTIKTGPSRSALAPIVALTANDTGSDRQLAQEAGMDGFLTKPFTYDKMVQVIGEIGSDKSQEIHI